MEVVMKRYWSITAAAGAAVLVCGAIGVSSARDRDTESRQSAWNGADLEEQAAQPLVGQSFTPDGKEIGLDQGPSLAIQVVDVTACFLLNATDSLGNIATWFINATLDVTAYPYTIVGGTLSGDICDSPNWVLTGGTVGSNLTINGGHVGTPGVCARTVTIVGPFSPPAGYTGTYGFGLPPIPIMFSHSTLLLGFNRSCP